MRNPLFKKEEVALAPVPKVEVKEEATNTQVVEREVNLSLVNEKLNYVIGLLHKICEAGEINLN